MICAALLKRQKSRSRLVSDFYQASKYLGAGEKAWMDMARWEKCRDAWTVKLRPTGQCGSALTFPTKLIFQLLLARSKWRDVYVRSRFWIPEGRLEACSKQQADLYRKWNLAGYLEFTDGDVVDHAVIKEETISWVSGESMKVCIRPVECHSVCLGCLS
jgi:phage terminase large subunit-like protein